VLDEFDERRNRRHQADRRPVLGPEELVRQNMAALGAVVVFVTVLAPLARLVGTLYVLIRLHEAGRPAICAVPSPGPSGCAHGR